MGSGGSGGSGHGRNYSYGVDLSILPSRHDCVRPPAKGNKWYPLPPLFDKLSNAEQSWWRVNACCIQETPRDLVRAYSFFFCTYMWPVDAMFLEDRRMPPPFHYQMVHDVAAYHYNAFGAPRFACKTTVLKILTLLLLLTRRGYRIGYLTSKQRKYREFVNDIRKQLSNNHHILDDFGDTKSGRGAGETWNSELAELAPPFYNSLTGMSLESRERGWHGECLFIDDPEKDPDTDDVIPEYVRKLDMRLRHVFMPMVEVVPDDLHRRDINRVGRTISYFGTIIGEGMVLNRIITAEPGGPYDAWNSWKFEQENQGYYLWPERWGKRSSEIQRRVLGTDAFDAEKQNRPGKSQKGMFEIHPLFTSYHIDDTDGFLDDPWNSKSVIRWAIQTASGHVWKSLMARELIPAMNVGIIVDPAHTEKVTQQSDYTVAHVFGNDANSCLWSLDIARGRWSTEEVVERVAELCFRWRPTFVAIEACGLYARLADEITLRLFKELLERVGWAPYPKQLGPFNKVTESKSARIQRVTWRFRTNRIKFPWWRKNDPPYDQCFHEVENFTADLSRLKYDDIIDTIGSTPYVFRGPGGRPIKSNPWEGRTVEQLIQSGKVVTPHGAHLVDMIPSISDLSDKSLHILEAYYENKDRLGQRGPDGERKIRTVESRPARLVSV